MVYIYGLVKSIRYYIQMPMCVGKYYIVNKDMDIILLVQEKCCIACLFDLFLFVNVVLCIFMSIVFVCAAVLRIVYATYSRLCRKYPLSAP